MRAASLALYQTKRLLLQRYPAANEVPEGEEHYHRAIYFHRLGTDPTDDPLVYGRPEGDWPGRACRQDGLWLLIEVARTFDQTDLYLRDLASNGPLLAWQRTRRPP